MLRGISWKQFVEWQASDALDPFEDVKNDYRAASIVSMLVNLRRDVTKYPTPFDIETFLLQWGDKAEAILSKKPTETKPIDKPAGKTWQQLKLIGQICAAMYNQAEDRHNRRRKKD